MSLHEREHLDYLIHRLPELDVFLKDYFQNSNLTEVITLFEEQHEVSLKKTGPRNLQSALSKDIFKK